MKIKSLNVEELSREMKRQRTIVIQEIADKNSRQWLFRGEQLKQLRKQNIKTASFPEGAEVFLVCEDSDVCQKYAADIADRGWTVRYLAGGHLAWSQFYHPVVVGFDEKVKIWQIHRLARGCLSYMIEAGEAALIVDPCYHIDYYLGLAHRERTDIQCVVDLHVHRDHVSGGARLAAKTNSPYYIPSHEQLKADSRPLEKQSSLPLKNTQIDIVPFPPINPHEELSVGLWINEKFLLTGDQPLRDDVFRESLTGNSHLRHASDSVIVLPAHTQRLDRINEHGLVAMTLGQVRGTHPEETGEQSIVTTRSSAPEPKIYEINLMQKEITLDRATELELGLKEE